MANFNPIISGKEDGLCMPHIGIWGLKKYNLLGAYCDIFTTGMKYHWKQLVYIDLFAGAGYAKIKGDNRIINTSALIAASIPTKFTRYILCEFDEEGMDALKKRFASEHPDLMDRTTFILGDSNQNIDKILNEIPNDNNALRFCFADPFSLNLEFETIKKISQIGRVDFLILLALLMDGKRNFRNYVKDETNKIDKFIDNTEWREPFKEGKIPQQDFIKYLADCYDKNMIHLSYIVDKHLKYLVKSDNKNLPLYYLAFYSKNKRGNDFYKKIEKYQDVQLNLF